MKERLQHIEFRPYTGLKHVDASTTEKSAPKRVPSRKKQANSTEIARNVISLRVGNGRNSIEPLHLGQQLLLAGFFGTQVQIKAALLHAVRRCHGLLTPTKQGGGFAGFP